MRVATVLVGLWATGCTADAGVSAVAAPILGGAPATADEIFGTVAVHAATADSVFVCGGVLIAPDLVVTAAHCLAPLDAELRPEPVPPPEQIRVLAGVLTWDAATERETYVAARTVVHPEWPTFDLPPPSGVGTHHDIAIVVIERDVDTVEVMPILQMERVDAEAIGARALITGYGWRAPEPTDEGTLYVARTPVVDRSDRELLLGGAGQPDVCSGDSGSPSYLETSGGPAVIGVASRGRLDRSTECGEGSIHTLVPAYRAWIEDAYGAPMPPDDPGFEHAESCSVARARPPSSAALLLGIAAIYARARRWRTS